ncbi:MAG: hypothetical protein R2747_17750 [Pyrinomonadaceae bacterium]
MKSLKTALLCGLLLCLPAVSGAMAQKLKPEEVVAKHLDSIGTAEKRASLKTMMAVGDATVTFLSQKNQSAQGRIVLASASEKNFFGLNLNAVDYPFEKFTFDGKKSKVAIVRTSRTILGNFISSNDLLLEESLLGGTLSTSWALHNLTDKKAKLSFNGTKKIDGKEVYAIGYSRKSGGDIDITLYFDKETFRHVRTEYKRTSSAAQGRTIDQSARQSETHLKVTEDYSDFKDESGLTLPHGYRLLYSISGQNGTSEVEWKFSLTEFAFNRPIDDKTFDPEN